MSAVAEKRISTPELERMRAKIDAELAARSQADDADSLTSLRRKLKEHRTAMRQTPGGIIALEDERIERQLLRAIELAKAPATASQSQADDLERTDGLTNEALSGPRNEEDAEE